jgi:hypothetical protein
MMNLRLCLLCLLFFVLATTDVFADNGDADSVSVIRELCQNGQTEGGRIQAIIG